MSLFAAFEDESPAHPVFPNTLPPFDAGDRPAAADEDEYNPRCLFVKDFGLEAREPENDSPIVPRPYQVQAAQSAQRILKAGKSCLIKMPTASGKTVTFGLLVVEWLEEDPGHVPIILVHRDDLLIQAFRTVRRMVKPLGDVTVHIEQAALRANLSGMFGGRHVVVASVQTLCRERRLRRFDPARFKRCIIDECQHCIPGNRTYWDILKHFRRNPDFHEVGVTATPDRLDEEAMEQVFAEVAINYSVQDAVDEGWIVRPVQKFVEITGLDLADVNEYAGDLNPGELDRVLTTKKLMAVVAATYRISNTGGDRRPTIYFATSVKKAELAARMFNRLARRDGQRLPAALALSGKDDYGVRRNTFKAFERGEFQYLCVCGLCTEGFDCLDRDTEVLTANGWRGRGEVGVGDLIWSLNRPTGRMELVPVQGYAERPVSLGERMVSFTSQHLNIRVTEGHEVHFRTKDSRTRGRGEHMFTRSWRTKTAGEFVGSGSSFYLPLAARSEFPGVPLTEDEIRFVAWFMTDGGFVSPATVSITQSVSKHHERIRSLLKRIGFDFRERLVVDQGFPNSQPVWEFSIPKGTHFGSMKRNGWHRLSAYLDKNVSPLLQAMTRDQFAVFWEEAMFGYGARKNDNSSGWLWCDRKEQADAYTGMAVVRGFAASHAPEVTAYGTVVYRVSVRDSSWIGINPADPRATKVEYENPHPGEVVWCVKNTNGTLVTRRGGKIAVLGNCPQIRVVVPRPTTSRSLYEQMAGRGFRPLPGILEGHGTAEARKAAIAASAKPSALILDFHGNSDNHRLVHTGHILGGNYSGEAQRRAAARVKRKKGGVGDMAVELAEVRKEIELETEKRRERMIVDVTYRMRTVDPFVALKVRTRKVEPRWFKDKVPSIKMARFLEKNHIKTAGLTFYQAKKLIDKIVFRRDRGLSTYRQMHLLGSFGYDDAYHMTFDEAKALIDRIRAAGWRRPEEAAAAGY